MLRELPVVVLGTKPMSPVQGGASVMQANAYLTKPLSPRHLVEVVEHLASG